MQDKATFWTLLRESVIMQGLLTLMLAGTLCYLYAMGKPVPPDLAKLTFAVVAFWMGSKSQHAIEKTSRSREELPRGHEPKHS